MKSISSLIYDKNDRLTVWRISWIISLGLGVIPSSVAGKDFKFYENSHVCIGLPLVFN